MIVQKEQEFTAVNFLSNYNNYAVCYVTNNPSKFHKSITFIKKQFVMYRNRNHRVTKE